MIHLDTLNVMQLGLCNDVGCIKLCWKSLVFTAEKVTTERVV